MEDYLLYMKTLRSQMNDVEDQTAKITVEEQMQLTTIQTLEIDLNSAKSETKQLKEDTEQMMKAKGQICSQILERQRKIVSLESDSSTLAQVQLTPSAGAYMCVQALGCETLFCTKLLERYTKKYLILERTKLIEL